MAKSKKRNRSYQNRSFAQEAARGVRDFFVTCARNGSILPLFIVFGVLMIMLFKLSPEQVEELLRETMHYMANRRLIGWVGTVLAIGLWYTHARFQRRIWQKEMERIAEEKGRLQRKLAGREFPTSNRD